ncbi:DEAD/DEAH box helicase [Paenibacillus lutimineralis]|uniref:DEAD/DEAH box helicase n=1 Tax=Paenibacillus lutimineralis TaxID=2707005 RepID=A0A3S9V4Y3_9BACL|nr:helicase-related protein [Paenibacillus lutimineralis]AZS17600.1 DEAD/DEAH box helicase [Paenibacillus lutimineralis]
MKVAVYAVRLEQVWKLMISLDIGTDLGWCLEERGWLIEKTGRNGFREGHQVERCSTMVLLSAVMPLGWAVQLRDSFQAKLEMDGWKLKGWHEYIRGALKRELEQERQGGVSGYHAEENLLGLRSGGVLWTRREGLTLYGEMVLEQYQRERYEEMHGSEAMWREAVDVMARRITAALEGRSLLEAELQQLLAERLPELVPAWRSAVQHAHLQGLVLLTAGVAAVAARGLWGPLARLRARYRCRRCGSEVHSRTPCGSCGSSGCAYCEACLALGRSRSCALLLRGSAEAVPPPAGGTGAPLTGSLLDRWGLSPAQRDAASAALQFLAQPQVAPAEPAPRYAQRPGRLLQSRERSLPRFLLWAVTGAGKTEMIFPLIHYTLSTGGKVLVATPRRDVVLELAPRISKAFPEEKIAVLYGGSTQRWEEARLILATTHQLMRFYHAFDLVIIDELDAFPYHNDPMLAFAAKESCKGTGRFIFLSATPPAQMQREVRQGKLEHAKVPARFHGHPLPVPRRIRIESVEGCLRRRSLPSSLAASLEQSIQRGAQIFIFVSRIRHIEPLTGLLRRRFSSISVEGTSSQDELRAEKVLDFRATKTRVLVTTTILERGVTVPKSDVFILDADSDLFDEASLVQMAGRAGRSKDDPAGRVWFASPEWTRSQRGAVRQIRSMNTIAHKKGFLHA